MNLIKRGFTLMLLAFLGYTASAQTMAEAGEAFNQAISKMETDVDGAILGFRNTIAISEKLGDEGMDLKMKSSQIIPGLYLKKSNNLYKAKDLAGAITAGEEAIKASTEFNDENVKAQATNLVSQFYMVQANGKLKTKDYDGAISEFNRSLELNPSLTKSLLGLMIVYKEKEDVPNMEATLERLNAVGAATDDASKAKSILQSHLLAIGAKALQGNNNEVAVENITKSLTFGESADAYYYLTAANNKLQKWDAAIEAANKGIALEQKDKNRFYFELGTAYAGKGDSDNACTNFKLVKAGPNLKSAQYQVKTVLKCK